MSPEEGLCIFLLFLNTYFLYSGGLPAKRGRPKKAQALLEDRYPALTAADPTSDSSYETNMQALSIEVEQSNPRKEIYLPLMKETFLQRREFVLTAARSVSEVISAYPALRLSASVCCISPVMHEIYIYT